MNHLLAPYPSARSDWNKNLSLMIFLALVFAGIFVFNKVSSMLDGVGSETKPELVVKVKQLDQNVKDTIKGAEIAVETATAAADSVVSLNKGVYESKKKTEDIQAKKEKKVDDIKVTSDLTPEQKDQKIAEAEINMLWENYCRIDSTSCKEKQNG